MTPDDRPVEGRVVFPPVTPERFYYQDKLWRDKALFEQRLQREIARSRAQFPELWADRDRIFEQ